MDGSIQNDDFAKICKLTLINCLYAKIIQLLDHFYTDDTFLYMNHIIIAQKSLKICKKFTYEKSFGPLNKNCIFYDILRV